MWGDEAVGWTGGGAGAGGSGGGGAYAMRVIQVPISAINGTKTITSTTTLPVGAIVYECGVDITVGLAALATISVGQSGHLTEFQGTGDNTPQTPGLYQKNQVTTPASATPVVVTVVSSTTTGAGFAYVRYASPQS